MDYILLAWAAERDVESVSGTQQSGAWLRGAFYADSSLPNGPGFIAKGVFSDRMLGVNRPVYVIFGWRPIYMAEPGGAT